MKMIYCSGNHLCLAPSTQFHTGVCEKDTPPDRKTNNNNKKKKKNSNSHSSSSSSISISNSTSTSNSNSEHVGRQASGEPNHGLESNCCYWTAGQRPAEKECFSQTPYFYNHLYY